MEDKSTIRLWKENCYTTTTEKLKLNKVLISKGQEAHVEIWYDTPVYIRATEDKYRYEKIVKITFSDSGQFLCFTDGGAVYKIEKGRPATENSEPVLDVRSFGFNKEEEVLCAFTDKNSNMVVFSRKTPYELIALIRRKNDILYKRVYDRNTRKLISANETRFNERGIYFTGDCIVTENHKQVLFPGIDTIWEFDLNNDTLRPKYLLARDALEIGFSGNGLQRLEHIHLGEESEQIRKVNGIPYCQIDCSYIYVDEVNKKMLTIKNEIGVLINSLYPVILSGNGEVGAITDGRKAEIYKFRHGSSEWKSNIYGDDFALSRDGTMIITRSKGLIRLCDTETGEQIRVLNTKDFWSPKIAISKDGRQIALVGEYGDFQLWSI